MERRTWFFVMFPAALLSWYSSPSSAAPIAVQRVASGLSAPLFVTAVPDDPSRLFIVEQGSGGTARIKILNLNNDTISPTPFLTLTGLATGGEEGLLGLAFDPNYSTNHHFYVDYSAPGGSFNAGIATISQYSVLAGNPNLADASSGKTLLTYDKPQTNHNGGWIGFSNRPGDSGNLYIATGDGGNGNDQGSGHTEPGGNGQNKNSLLGKMLRINVNNQGITSPAHPNYAIPANNPFASGGGAPEVFLYGLRNPFRDSFDRATGNLLIGDVGQDTREEVDVQKASNPGGGENYGWRLREGTIATPSGSPVVGGPRPAGAVDPILDYPHSTGQTIIGGYVYRGTDVPELAGQYIFADYLGPEGGSGKGRIFSLDFDGSSASNFTDITAKLFPAGSGITLSSPTSLGEDARGELYIVDAGSGQILKVVPEPGGIAALVGAGMMLLARRR